MKEFVYNLLFCWLKRAADHRVDGIIEYIFRDLHGIILLLSWITGEEAVLDHELRLLR